MINNGICLYRAKSAFKLAASLLGLPNELKELIIADYLLFEDVLNIRLVAHDLCNSSLYALKTSSEMPGQRLKLAVI
jgi:hypothetical protein